MCVHYIVQCNVNDLHFNIFLIVAGLTDFNALSMIFTSSGTLAP